MKKILPLYSCVEFGLSLRNTNYTVSKKKSKCESNFWRLLLNSLHAFFLRIFQAQNDIKLSLLSSSSWLLAQVVSFQALQMPFPPCILLRWWPLPNHSNLNLKFKKIEDWEVSAKSLLSSYASICSGKYGCSSMTNIIMLADTRAALTRFHSEHESSYTGHTLFLGE